MPEQKRTILIGAVGVVKGSVKNAGAAMVAVCDELDDILHDAWHGAPFETISLVIRWADETNLSAEIGRISPRHKELPVAVSVSMRDARAVQNDHAALTALIRSATDRAIDAVATKYRLPAPKARPN